MQHRSSETILDLTPPAASLRIAYGGEPEQFGDLWLPEIAESRRLVVFIHGGYWRARYELAHVNLACQALAEQGMVVWNVEYRRVGNRGGGWPGTFDDVLSALDCLPRLAHEAAFDLRRVILCGHSAGGHLALWAAAQALRGRVVLPGLRGVVALAPVSDLHQAWEWHLSQDAVVDLLGGTPNEVSERYDTASPAQMLPLHVPQVLIHGTADDAVPFAMSEQYASRAVAAGDRVVLVPLEGQGHFELIDPWSSAWPLVVGALRSL